MYSITTAVKKIAALKKRLRIIQGGSSAGKTIAILLILIDRAQVEKNKVFSIVSETIPHLKRGAIRDFLSIMEQHGYYDDLRWNRTDFIYTFETGTKIEFFSADNAEKVRGPRRQVLFINEANNVTYETYTQLAIRTSEEIYIDYNPVAQFWVHDEGMDKDPKNDFLIITYRDNEGLPENIVAELESRKDKKNWWTVFGLGELADIEGRIYSDWKIIDEVPHVGRLERRGLDFGYTNDPTSLVDVYYVDGGYVLDEQIFKKGMQNKQIADVLLNLPLPNTLVIADSAEPKSIDDIKGYGINILGAEKGKDSVVNGITLVQEQRISVTKRSTNIIKEYRNYMWKTDKEGVVLNIPEHDFSHSMDAIRYALTSILKKPKFVMPQPSAPLLPYYPEIGY